MPEIKLKPCPFCGEHNAYIMPVYSGIRDEAEHKSYEVVCDCCGASISIYDEYETLEEAAEAWNRRADAGNEPLTMEDLWKMDGEPIWMVSKINNTGEWGILRVHETPNSWFIGISGSCAVYGKDTYEKEWLAYRHKLREGE